MTNNASLQGPQVGHVKRATDEGKFRPESDLFDLFWRQLLRVRDADIVAIPDLDFRQWVRGEAGR